MPGPDGKLPKLADGFPSGPITFWSSQIPGHADEVYARVLAQAAQKYSPVPIVVQSKGAGPRLWWETMDYWKTLPNGAEGYHLGAVNLSAMPPRFHSVGAGDWTMDDTFKAILLGTEAENQALAVRWDAQWKDIQEFVKFAKENSGKVRLATSALGSLIHLNTEITAYEQKFKFVNIPHDGVGAAQQTVLGAGADAVGTQISQVAPMVDAKRLRVLLQYGDVPAAKLGNAPTTASLKWGGVGATRGWHTLPTVPEPRKEWLRALLELARTEQAYKDRLQNLGMVEYFKTAEEVAADLKAEDQQIIPILKDVGLFKQ